MITILHLITGLRQGGAERALVQLATKSDRTRFRHIVATLRDGGAWREHLHRAGIPVVALQVNNAIALPAALARLVNLLRREKPQILQSWLYHADFLAALTKKFAPRIRVIWTLRNSDLSANRRVSWMALTRSLAFLSGAPDLVVSNSAAGLLAHQKQGYWPRRSVVIPNGIDTNMFTPPPLERRTQVRADWGFSAEDVVIGMAARFDPAKGFPIFCKAVRIAKTAGLQAKWVLAGEGSVADNSELTHLLSQHGVVDQVTLVGPQGDMTQFYAGLDIATLTSLRGEGFPNVIAEAMACGLCVAATDSGDERAIVGDCGLVVAAGDADAIARSWITLAENPARAELGKDARARIVARFTLHPMISAYEQVYEEFVRDLSSNK